MKIKTFALVSALSIAASGAFAGGIAEPVMEAAPVVVDGGSSSALPIWIPLVGGAILVAALVSGDSSTSTTAVVSK